MKNFDKERLKELKTEYAGLKKESRKLLDKIYELTNEKAKHEEGSPEYVRISNEIEELMERAKKLLDRSADVKAEIEYLESIIYEDVIPPREYIKKIKEVVPQGDLKKAPRRDAEMDK